MGGKKTQLQVIILYVSEKELSALFVLDSFRKSLCHEAPCPEVAVKLGDVMVKSLGSWDRGLDANLPWLPPEKPQASYSHHIVFSTPGTSGQGQFLPHWLAVTIKSYPVGKAPETLTISDHSGNVSFYYFGLKCWMWDFKWSQQELVADLIY